MDGVITPEDTNRVMERSKSLKNKNAPKGAKSNLKLNNTKMTKLIAPKGQKFERELIPAGLHKVVCYSIVDLGTQEIEWKGEKKYQRKIMITFEFPKLIKEFEGVKKPLVKGIKFTLSMHEKSNLRKQLTGWLGKDTGEEFDIMTMIGKPAQVQILHTKADNGNTYDNINAILPLEEDIEPFNPIVMFSLTDFNQETFDGLHQWLKDIIIKSPEYKELDNEVEDEDGTETLPF